MNLNLLSSIGLEKLFVENILFLQGFKRPDVIQDDFPVVTGIFFFIAVWELVSCF